MVTFDADELAGRTTVLDTLGIVVEEATAERVVLSLDVGPAVHQPFGLLHGGVNVVLAETCASIGALLGAPEGHLAYGVEINANHLRSVREGRVVATGTPIRQGRTIAVWDTKIEDAEGRLTCVSRCTVAIRPAADAP